MFSAGHVDDLDTTKIPLFEQNINDICAVSLQLHENDTTFNVCDLLPVQETVEVYKLLESISMFKYNERTPQFLCSTCLFKLKDAQDNSKLEVGDVELGEDEVITDASNERKDFYGEACVNQFSEESIENTQVHVIAESPKPLDLVSTSTKPLKASTYVVPQATIVSTDSIERDISTYESIGNLDLELTGTQPSNVDICTKNDHELNRQIQNPSSDKTNKAKRDKLVCKYCNKVWYNRLALKYHVDMHEDVRNCVCAFCGQQFRTPTALIIHERGHTGQKPYKCDHCQKTYTSKSLLIRHTDRHHRPDQFYCCEVCGKKFKTKGDLRVHMAIHAHERLYKCSLCGKGYNQRGALKNHMYNHGDEDKNRPVSGKEKMFKCTQCEATFARARYLNRHRRGVHTERRYACKLCDCKYKEAQSLKLHMMKHTGIRPYACTHCNKDFSRKYNLNMHLRTHEVIQPVNQFN